MLRKAIVNVTNSYIEASSSKLVAKTKCYLKVANFWLKGKSSKWLVKSIRKLAKSIISVAQR